MRDADGWPPVDSETLWASEVGQQRFRIENAPWFVRDVAVGDVVKASDEDGVLTFEEVVEDGGHSTLRVFCDGPDETSETLRATLGELGCLTETAGEYKLLAIDVPPEVELGAVLSYLDGGVADGRWDYEEGALSNAHEA